MKKVAVVISLNQAAYSLARVLIGLIIIGAGTLVLVAGAHLKDARLSDIFMVVGIFALLAVIGGAIVFRKL